MTDATNPRAITAVIRTLAFTNSSDGPMKAMPPTNAMTMPAKQNTDSTARMMAVLSPGRTASDTVFSHCE